MKIILQPGIAVELFAVTGIDQGRALAISNPAGRRLRVSTDPDFLYSEYVKAGTIKYTRDSLTTLYVKTTSQTTIYVDAAGILTGNKEPDGLYTGLRAQTVQNYVEANIKNGLQYYIRASYPGADEIGAGTSRKIHFQTGAKYVIIKLEIIDYISEELAISRYVDPDTVSGGTPLVVGNFNLAVPVATTVIITKDVTTVGDGTILPGDPLYAFGGQSPGHSEHGATARGREWIIPPNTSYIIAITNNSNAASRCSYYLDWYEGTPDLPLIK